MLRFIGKSILGIILVFSFYTLSLQAQQTATPTPAMPSMRATPSMSGMLDTGFSVDDLAPLVQGIYEGEAVLFIVCK